MLDWKNAYRLILSILNRTRISRTQGCSSCCMTGQTKRETRVQDHVQRTWENFYQLLTFMISLKYTVTNHSLSLSHPRPSFLSETRDAININCFKTGYLTILLNTLCYLARGFVFVFWFCCREREMKKQKEKVMLKRESTAGFTLLEAF